MLNFTSNFSLPPAPSRGVGWGMGAADNLSHIFSAYSSSSGGGILVLLPCSSIVPFIGSSPSGTDYFSTGPPWSHRFCQEPALPWASHKVTACFRHPHSPVWAPPRTAGGYLLHCGPPWAAEGESSSPWSSSWAAGESLLWNLNLFLLLPHSFMSWA